MSQALVGPGAVHHMITERACMHIKYRINQLFRLSVSDTARHFTCLEHMKYLAVSHVDS